MTLEAAYNTRDGECADCKRAHQAYHVSIFKIWDQALNLVIGGSNIYRIQFLEAYNTLNAFEVEPYTMGIKIGHIQP